LRPYTPYTKDAKSSYGDEYTITSAPKPITATAHKLARIFYRLWTSGDRYIHLRIDAYEQQYLGRTLKNLKKKAQVFGLELISISNTTECVY